MAIKINYNPPDESVKADELHVGDTLVGKVDGISSVYLCGPSILIDLENPHRIWESNRIIVNAELVDLEITVKTRKDC